MLRIERQHLAFVLSGAAIFAACSGPKDSLDGQPPGGSPADGGTPSVDTADGSGAGPMTFRRLTRDEYTNTVRDLFGNPSLVVDLPADPTADTGFAAAPIVSDGTASSLLASAETLAAQAITNFDSFLACDYKTLGADACMTQFIARFGRLAYRKTMEPAEASALFALYKQVSAAPLGYGLSDATRLVVTAMLQSPRFLYHWERGPTVPATATVDLSPYEMASRLSYFLWSTMPDEPLLGAADANALSADTDVGAQIDRMMKDPRFSQTVNSFHEQWLSLDNVVQKDTSIYPQFDDALQSAMIAETERFLHYVFFEGDGKFKTLLTSTIADVDAPLAAIYGVPAPAKGVQRVTLDPSKRAGLLTRAALIAATTNAASTVPPRTGLLLWANVMCNTIGPPPPGAQADFHFDPTLSTRQNFAQLQTETACSSCHSILNPLGFAFETYDAIGDYRTMEGTHPIDASGTFPDNNQSFNSIVDLSAILAADPSTNKCMATNWLQFALARDEVSADDASFNDAFAASAAPDLDLRGFIRAVALSPTFRKRAVGAGEVSP